MGFHVCEWCETNGTLSQSVDMAFSPYSSVDVTLKFASGCTWRFPHTGLLHYVAVHGYCPPAAFIQDVMESTVIESDMVQTKSAPTPVGYLIYPELPYGDVPEGFVEKLMAIVKKLEAGGYDAGYRVTRGDLPMG
jgi:hypothetical protein